MDKTEQFTEKIQAPLYPSMKQELEEVSAVKGIKPGTLARIYIMEGLQRERVPSPNPQSPISNLPGETDSEAVA